MVEADDAHAVRLFNPDIRVAQAGMLRREVYGCIELEDVSGANLETEATAKPRLVGIGGNLRNGIAKGFGFLGHTFEGFFRVHFESDRIETGFVGFAERDGVVVKLVVGLQADAAVRGAGDFIKTKNILVEIKCFVQIQHAQLNQTRPERLIECHVFFSPFLISGFVDW
ncbi:hypothetical protein SDC9_160954 [bioreactor metagenome]|uniref:Uncharacterized protein n=1 Tax=bioreactor metagenome TaxID=1076179 RepID=A0A645FJC4_9ZZZZ